MGQSLSSAIEECNVSEFPEYVKSYFAQDGDETFMVYQPVERSETSEFKANYSGPSRNHLRDEYNGAPQFEYANRDDASSTESVNNSLQQSLQSPGKVAGSGMYESISPSKSAWEIAEVSFDNGVKHQDGSETRSTNSGPSTASRVSAVDELVGRIVDSYPEDIRELMIKTEESVDSDTSGEEVEAESSRKRVEHGDKQIAGNEPDPANDSFEVCRQEESRLLKMLTIVVHPVELEEDDSENEDESEHKENHWFLVESDWFRKWTAFLKGSERPGPIDNSKLLNESGEPWPGLEPGRNYVAVDYKAWGLLTDLYGGAEHPVVRGTFNIYAPAVSAEP